MLLVGAEGRGKDMLISIARRRFAASAVHVFPPRLRTRPTGFDCGDVVVSRRDLRRLGCEGRLIATWRVGDAEFGLPYDSLRALEAGAVVTIAVSAEAIEALEAAWSDVCVIEVKSGPDSVRGRREPLVSSAKPDRSSSPDCKATSSAVEARPLAMATHVICHAGDMATAAASLHAYLEVLVEPARRGNARGPLGSPCRTL